MSRFLKALLVAGLATGAAALILKYLDLDAADAGDDAPFPGMDPDTMPEEDVELLLKELASHLG